VHGNYTVHYVSQNLIFHSLSRTVKYSLIDCMTLVNSETNFVVVNNITLGSHTGRIAGALSQVNRDI